METVFYRPAFSKLSPEKRETILAVAIRHFARHGYEGAGINQIAREAGISIGALYSYFPNKENLFLHICSEGQRLMNEMADELRKRALPLRESLDLLFCLTVDYSLRYPELTQIYLNLSGLLASEQLRRLSYGLESSFASLYAGLLQKAAEQGEIPADLDRSLAALTLDNQLILLQFSLCSAYYGARLRHYLGPDILGPAAADSESAAPDAEAAYALAHRLARQSLGLLGLRS